MLPGGHDNFTENTHFERGDITLTARCCFVRDLLLRGSAFKTARGGGKGGVIFCYMVTGIALPHLRSPRGALLRGDRDRAPRGAPWLPAGPCAGPLRRNAGPTARPPSPARPRRAPCRRPGGKPRREAGGGPVSVGLELVLKYSNTI